MHYAARFSSPSFVSLLLSAGASPVRRGPSGLPRDYAEAAEKPAIVQILDNAAATYVPEMDSTTMLVNGIEVTEEKWNHYKQLLFNKNESTEETSSKSRSGRNRSKTVSESPNSGIRGHLLLQLIQINSLLLSDNKDPDATWSGILRFPDGDEWLSEYCTISGTSISVLSDSSRNIPLEGVVSLRAYSEANSRFAIVYGNEADISMYFIVVSVIASYLAIEYFAAKPALVPPILKGSGSKYHVISF